jgi:hypothetical protein
MNASKTITFTLAADRPLSADEQAMLARDIDYSDIPPSPPDARWTRPKKQNDER